MAVDISVIIPAYNAELTIGRAVRSALESQAFKLNIECVVCDDGSTDTTKSQAEKAGAKVFSQANAGPSSALNVALANAKGKYCLCLAADDWLEDHSLMALFSKAVDQALIDDKRCFVAGATRYHGMRTGVFHPNKQPDFRRHNATLYAFLYPREVIAHGVRYHTFRAGYGLEDWDFALQLTEIGYEAMVIDDVVLNHVYTGSGLHAKTLHKRTEFMDEMRERHPQLSKEATL